jgi:hypothetical protein
MSCQEFSEQRLVNEVACGQHLERFDSMKNMESHQNVEGRFGVDSDNTKLSAGLSAELSIGKNGVDAKAGATVEATHELWHEEREAGPFTFSTEGRASGEIMPHEVTTQEIAGKGGLEAKSGVANPLGDELYCSTKAEAELSGDHGEARADGRCGLMAAFDQQTRVGVAGGIERSTDPNWFSASVDTKCEVGGDAEDPVKCTTEAKVGVLGRYLSLSVEKTE